MLDKINGNQTDVISQSGSPDRIKEVELKNNYRENDSVYFVDESDISLEAYQKYQKENDIKYFSNILMQTDEEEANNLVLQKAFNGTISLSETDIFGEMINNSGLINDIA